MLTSQPLRVFLCHASADKPAVRKLHRYLKQRGIIPWLDELNLLPGQKWEIEIPKALHSSDVILVCLSKNSVTKEGYVQKEITFALDKANEKLEETIFIIPTKLEECEVPQRLRDYQWVDLFRNDGYKRLMQSLKKRAIDLGPSVLPIIDDTQKFKPIVNQEKQPAYLSEKIAGEISSPISLQVDKDKPQDLLESNLEEIRLTREKIELEQKADMEKKAKEEQQHITAQKAEEEHNKREGVIVPATEGKKSPISQINAAAKSQPLKVNLKRTLKTNTIISAIVVILVLFCAFGVIYYGSLAPETSLSTLPSMVSNIYTSTGTTCNIKKTTFSTNEDVYVCIDLVYTQLNTQFESRWYYQQTFFGKILHFQIIKLTNTIDSNQQFTYFYLNNLGIAGTYRVDIYKGQKIIGTRYYTVEK